MKDPRITLSALLALLLIGAARVHASVTSASLSTYSIPFETIGTTGTNVRITLDTPGNIELDIHKLQNVNDQPSQDNLVAAIQQANVSSGTFSMFWDALWLIGGDQGRLDGSYQFIITESTGASQSVYVIPTLLQITSVDIHNVSAIPSFDADQNPAFPFRIQYSLAKDSLVTLKVKNSLGTVVRTLLSNTPKGGEPIVSTNTYNWDGLDDNKRPVPLGIYTLTLDARDPLSADVAIQRTRTMAVQSLANLDTDINKTFEQNAFVYPNPIREGSATFNLLAVRNNATITLRIYTISGDMVLDKSFPGLATGDVTLFPWNASNQAGRAVGRGLYYYVVRETDEVGTLQTVKKLAVIK
jgi:flagellar hook assembly protein FlgD